MSTKAARAGHRPRHPARTITYRHRLVVFLAIIALNGALAGSLLFAETRGEPIGPLAVGALFENNCAGCHNTDMKGGIGPSLVDRSWQESVTDEEIFGAISYGHPQKGMPAFDMMLDVDQRRRLVALIRQVGSSKSAQTPGTLPFPATAMRTEHASFRVETVVGRGLESPWSMVFLDPARILVTEQPGRLRIVHLDGTVEPPLKHAPVIRNYFDFGGMLGLALHPDFRRNGYIYLAYTDEQPDHFGQASLCAGRMGCYASVSQIRIIRFRIRGNELIDTKPIWAAKPETYRATAGFGGSLAFGRDGMLYFAVGDRTYMPMEAQDLSTPNGKIHRVKADGSIPRDNPFAGIVGADPSIWSFGSRNQLGLAVDPRSGQLWSSENGPRGGDELNIIRRGGNYGWPLTTRGVGYDGLPFDPAYALGHTQPAVPQPSPRIAGSAKNLIEPVTYWVPSISPSNISFYSGRLFPEWKGSLLVGSLRAERLVRLDLDRQGLVGSETLFEGHGRVRYVTEGPDGAIYLAMNRPDQIVRIVPAK